MQLRVLFLGYSPKRCVSHRMNGIFRLIHTFFLENTSELQSENYKSKLSPLPQFFLKPQNTFGARITLKRSSWLCWRANPAGFPPTTVAAANKLKKILPDVRGKSYTGNTPGSRGERILPCEGRDHDRRPKPQKLLCHEICEENVAGSLGSLHIRGGCTGVPHIRGWGHQWFAGVIKRLYISDGRHQRRTTNNQKHTTRLWRRILNVEWKQMNNKGSHGTIIHSS